MWTVPFRPIARQLHRRLGYPLLALLLPTDCFSCGHELGRFQLQGACLPCWAGFRWLSAPICSGCGLPRPPITDLVGPVRTRCATCLLSPPPTETIRGALAYDRHARRFLLRAKLGRRRELFRPLGLQLARTISLCPIPRDCSVIVPVPSHPWMTLLRGFSPASEIARPLARELGLPIDRRLLRFGFRSRLAGKRLGALDRQASRLSIHVRGNVRGRSVLLVDDVMTTGSTVRACARALRRAGAVEIHVAVWARTLPR